MAKKKVFHAHMGSCQYVFRSGKVAAFINHRYITDIESEIAELEMEIKSGHPHLYIKSDEAEIDADQMSPLAEIEAKMRAKILAEMAAATDKSNDRGNTGTYNPQAGLVNSDVIAEVVAGSDSAAVGTGKLSINVGKAGK